MQYHCAFSFVWECILIIAANLPFGVKLMTLVLITTLDSATLMALMFLHESGGDLIAIQTVLTV